MKKIIFSVFLSLVSILAYPDAVVPVKHKTIVGDTTVYTSAQIDQMLEGVKPASKKIAMFIIPLNDSPSTTVSTAYTQFELKASTNNFDSAKSSEDRLVYYVHSGHADEFDIVDNDKAKLYINHGGADQRSYVKIENTLTDTKIISYAPSEIIVLVDASCCWSERSNGQWIDSESDNLIWTWVRTKNDSREIDPGTSHCLWRPIAPVKWFSTLPSWAN